MKYLRKLDEKIVSQGSIELDDLQNDCQQLMLLLAQGLVYYNQHMSVEPADTLAGFAIRVVRNGQGSYDRPDTAKVVAAFTDELAKVYDMAGIQIMIEDDLIRPVDLDCREFKS